MSFVCEFCKCTYEWGMYYNNHMKMRHNSKIEKRKKVPLTLEQKTILLYYFKNVSDRPKLSEIKKLAESINMKKESVYWWFHNQRYKIMRQNIKIKKTCEN